MTFNGNGNSSRNRVYFFWVYRCAELTLQQGYSLYVVHPKQPNAWNPGPAQASALPALYTGDTGGGLVKTHGGGTTMIIVPGVGGGRKTLWTYSATINMYRKPLPEDVLWGVDAQQTVNLLKSYVTSDANTKPPSVDELFRKAFIAHAQISVGGGASAEIDASLDSAARLAGTAGMPNAPPRSVDDVADALSEARLLAFHAMYRYYVTQLKPANPMGDVVLEFSISPAGRVRDCKVVSSTIKDRGFAQAVATLVKQTEFAPKNVGVTLVKDFHISFAPLPVG